MILDNLFQKEQHKVHRKVENSHTTEADGFYNAFFMEC